MFNFFKLSSSAFADGSLWSKWARLNRLLLAYSCIAFGLSLFVASEQIYEYYQSGSLQNNGAWFILPIGVLGGLWWQARQQAMRLYDDFLKEVETRQHGHTSTTLNADKQRVMNAFAWRSSGHTWKAMGVLLCASWAYTYIAREIVRMSLHKPVLLSVQIKENLTQQQKRLRQLTYEYCEMFASLRHHQAKVTALKRTRQYTLASLQEQWANFYVGQGTRALLGKEQGASPDKLRQNMLIVQAIRGQMEIYLFLQNKEASAADGLLAQDDKLITGFQDLLQVYDRYLEYAQKSVFRDQMRISGLSDEIKHTQLIVERLMVALAHNKRLRDKLTYSAQKNAIYWAKRLAYERRKAGK